MQRRCRNVFLVATADWDLMESKKSLQESLIKDSREMSHNNESDEILCGAS